MHRFFYIILLIVVTSYNELNAQNIQSATIQGKHYIGRADQSGFYVTRNNRDTLLNLRQSYSDFQFKDFNKDGYKDIYLEWTGNNLNRFTLYLFVPATGKFKLLKGFSDLPMAEPLPGTPFYYSYFPSGCADLAWGSHLFYVRNYTAVKVAKIKGDGCGIDDRIDIFKVVHNKESLIRRLPLSSIQQYKDTKWGFIRAYWLHHYKKFVSGKKGV